SLTQPGWPKSHGSRWPLVKPHEAISLIAHSPAAFRLGEPVTRGPWTSVSICSVCMIVECALASRRILALMSGSSFDWATTGASRETTAMIVEIGLNMEVILPPVNLAPGDHVYRGVMTKRVVLAAFLLAAMPMSLAAQQRPVPARPAQ